MRGTPTVENKWGKELKRPWWHWTVRLDGHKFMSSDWEWARRHKALVLKHKWLHSLRGHSVVGGQHGGGSHGTSFLSTPGWLCCSSHIKGPNPGLQKSLSGVSSEGILNGKGSPGIKCDLLKFFPDYVTLLASLTQRSWAEINCLPRVWTVLLLVFWLMAEMQPLTLLREPSSGSWCRQEVASTGSSRALGQC